MTNLDYYLLKDHGARQRTTIISLGLGAFLAVFLHVSGLSLHDTSIVCVVAACAVELARALAYKQDRVTAVVPFRGAVLRATFATVVILIAVLLRVLYAPITVQAALDSAEQEAKVGNIEDANKRVQEVSGKLERLKKNHVPARAGFFAFAVNRLNQLPPAGVPAESVHDALVQLAEYRAGINGPDEVVRIGDMRREGQFTLLKDSVISSQNAVQIGSDKGFVLDGFILDNVTFQDTTIIYKGARPVKLHNIRFINCRFLVNLSPQGTQLLTALVEPVVNTQIGEIPPEILRLVQ